MSAPSRIVTDNRVARYVADKCGVSILPPYTVMGLERNGEIVAGVVFNTFSSRDIEVTVAGECGAFTLGFLRAVGDYVFKTLDCLRISITTRQQHVKDIALRLGAQPEGVKRNRYGKGEDAELFGILAEDWAIRCKM
jgi:hypothetical protein